MHTVVVNRWVKWRIIWGQLRDLRQRVGLSFNMPLSCKSHMAQRSLLVFQNPCSDTDTVFVHLLISWSGHTIPYCLKPAGAGLGPLSPQETMQGTLKIPMGSVVSQTWMKMSALTSRWVTQPLSPFSVLSQLQNGDDFFLVSVCVCVFRCRSGHIIPRWSSEGKVQTPPANAGRGPAGPGLVSFLSDPVFSHSCSLSPTASPSPPTSGPAKL